MPHVMENCLDRRPGTAHLQLACCLKSNISFFSVFCLICDGISDGIIDALTLGKTNNHPAEDALLGDDDSCELGTKQVELLVEVLHFSVIQTLFIKI